VRARILNQRGIEQFAAFLSSLEAAAGREPPFAMLEDDFLAIPSENDVEVELRDFSSRFDLAQYLCGALPGAGSSLDHNRGLWSWLALFYFEQICPKEADGCREIGEVYRYILSPDYRHYYRHLLAMPYVVYRLHGQFSRSLLSPPVHIHGDFAEQLASRQEIITNRGLIEAVDHLYYAPDGAGGAPKRGATNRKKGGTLRRLIDVIQQFDLTYDLYGMSAREILSVLPHEFTPWMQPAGDEGP
jgi:hypothetical protein